MMNKPRAVFQGARATMATQRNQRLDIHLNLNVRGMKPSATVTINERSDELRRHGKRVYKLGLGQSPFPVPDVVVKALQEKSVYDTLVDKGVPFEEVLVESNLEQLQLIHGRRLGWPTVGPRG